MAELTPELVRDALADKGRAVETVISAVTPVIQARVARALLRRRGLARGRDVRQELEDITQDTFVALFADGGRLLRQWDPSRGMGLQGFVGLVAEQQVAAVLRSRRKSPWTEDPTEADGLDAPSPQAAGPEARIASRDELAKLLDLVRAELTPLGLDMFERLMVRQQPVKQICAELEMTPDAVYAWRTRLRRQVRRLAAELASGSDDREKAR